MPRARAIRSVRSWSGVAVPSSAASGAGRALRLVDHAAGRPASGRRRAGRGRRGRRSPPPGSRRPSPPPAPGAPGRPAPRARRDPSGCRTSPVVASIAGRWPWRNVSRSRIVVGIQAASSILSASSRAAGRSAPDAIGDDRARSRRGSARSPRRRPRRGPAGQEQVADRARRRVARPASCVGDRRRGDDRRQVADRVAPAVVHLDGRDDESRRPRPPPAGDPALPVIDRRPRSGRRRRLERPDRRRRPALVRDPDHEPAGRRVERELERLGRRGSWPGRSAARRPAAPSRRISTTACAACSLVPQPVTMIGAPLLAAWPIAPASRPAGPCRVGEPVEDPLGEERLGGDHVGHVERRPGADRSAVGSSSHGSGAAASGARGSNVVIGRVCATAMRRRNARFRGTTDA